MAESSVNVITPVRKLRKYISRRVSRSYSNSAYGLKQTSESEKVRQRNAGGDLGFRVNYSGLIKMYDTANAHKGESSATRSPLSQNATSRRRIGDTGERHPC